MDEISASALKESFESSEDDIWVPDLSHVSWSNRDFLGWIHPSGHLGYVVLISPQDGSLKGVVMRRLLRSSTRVRLDMCCLCHHVHRLDGTAMFTVTEKGSRGRRTIANVVCKDLDCSLRLRNLAEPGSLMTETLYPEAKIWRMQKTLYRWLTRAKYL